MNRLKKQINKKEILFDKYFQIKNLKNLIKSKLSLKIIFDKTLIYGKFLSMKVLWCSEFPAYLQINLKLEILTTSNVLSTLTIKNLGAFSSVKKIHFS